MAKQHPFFEAANLAGQLYGKILDRNADKGGFDYVLDSLQQGRKSVRQHAVEMVLSDEFRDKFIKGCSSRFIVALLHKIVVGRELSFWRLIPEIANYELLGFRHYVENLTQTSRYLEMYGEDRVPGRGHLSDRKSPPPTSNRLGVTRKLVHMK